VDPLFGSCPTGVFTLTLALLLVFGVHTRIEQFLRLSGHSEIGGYDSALARGWSHSLSDLQLLAPSSAVTLSVSVPRLFQGLHIGTSCGEGVPRDRAVNDHLLPRLFGTDAADDDLVGGKFKH
jgi:hypothetical protein